MGNQTASTIHSLDTLFQDNNYVIPMYQRNYTWGSAEVNQLIQDVWDHSVKIKSEAYYLGTLVTYKREAENGELFEVIDGQQRLTTLNILLSVLKNKFGLNPSQHYERKLKFDCRKQSNDTLFQLSKNETNTDELNSKMVQAYRTIIKKIEELSSNQDKNNQKEFLKHLKTKVKLLHVEVPKDTELNHYFEIMNNRGEQLEKHDILKATLLSHLKKSPNERNAFAKIWDACSDMGHYVQYNFGSTLKRKIFSKELDCIPKNFEEIVDKIQVKSLQPDKPNSLENLLNDSEIGSIESEEKEEEQRFSSIVTFPNFLLHTLRVCTKKDIPLDDKRLIETFKSEVEANEVDRVEWVKQFGFALLKMRFLYDFYIIKRNLQTEDEDWSLKRIKVKENEYYSGTFANTDHNKRLTMLLMMFHVSFPQMIYKHWLNGALLFLYDNFSNDNKIDAASYTRFLEQMSDAFYFDQFGQRKLDYYDIIYTPNNKVQNAFVDEENLNLGTHVQNFIFNRLDYLIWKSIVVDKNDQFKIDKNINRFQFSVGNTSVEHFFPRNPIQKDFITISEHNIDKFGNLCLLSRSKNSKLSNNSPIAKADHFGKSEKIESLKLELMLLKSKNWNEDELKQHQKEMTELLARKTNL